MLERRNKSVKSERSTTKAPLDDADVRALLGRVDRVVITRGRNKLEVDPAEVELDDLKGRSGKYRAPIVVLDGTLVVGFSAGLLDEL